MYISDDEAMKIKSTKSIRISLYHEQEIKKRGRKIEDAIISGVSSWNRQDKEREESLKQYKIQPETEPETETEADQEVDALFSSDELTDIESSLPDEAYTESIR